MMIIFFGVEIFKGQPNLCIVRISSSFFATFFIPLALIHMVYIRNLRGGMEFVFFIFIVIWTLDTAAYAFGKMFCKHNLRRILVLKKQ